VNVRDLIKKLSSCDPEAVVYLMSQPNWPLEYAVHNVVTREAIDAESDEEPSPGAGTSPTDVFVVEGTMARYGSRHAWSAR